MLLGDREIAPDEQGSPIFQLKITTDLGFVGASLGNAGLEEHNSRY
jgi:hypothetical protein